MKAAITGKFNGKRRENRRSSTWIIALATLKRFEKGYRVPTDQTLAKIFKVLKKAGVEFQADGKRLGVSISTRKLPK
jgi:hypothetical protein